MALDYVTEIDRAACSLVLTGYVRGMLRNGDVPHLHRATLIAMTDAVSRAHGTLQNNFTEEQINATVEVAMNGAQG
jgi:hypothetical protein